LNSQLPNLEAEEVWVPWATEMKLEFVKYEASAGLSIYDTLKVKDLNYLSHLLPRSFDVDKELKVEVEES
jgi:hypothetical protein